MSAASQPTGESIATLVTFDITHDGADYSKALTADEMSRAWQNELDRINPPLATGGG